MENRVLVNPEINKNIAKSLARWLIENHRQGATLQRTHPNKGVSEIVGMRFVVSKTHILVTRSFMQIETQEIGEDPMFYFEKPLEVDFNQLSNV